MKQLKIRVRRFLQLLLMVPALCAFGAYAQQEGEVAGTNSIQSLSVSTEQDGKLTLKVGLKLPPKGQPAAFTINTPPRIAFDFPNTENGLGTSLQTFGDGDLRSANIVQAGSRTRVVINLAQMVGYDTRTEGNDVLITLQPKGLVGGPDTTSVAAHFADSTASAQSHSLRDIDFKRGSNGEGRVQIDLSDSNIGIDINQQGKALMVDFHGASLPRNLQRKLDVTDFATPVQTIDAFAQGGNARLAIEPKGLWEYSAYQTDNKFIIEVRTVVADPNKVVLPASRYEGDKLTLNFQNISTREALSVIADFTGLNMVISDSVSGSMTLRLKDVPWDQAFEIILQSKGLDKRVNGNVIQVAPREEIAAKEKIEFSSREEITQLEPLRTENFQLSYAKAADMVKLISDDKQKILSKRGSANFDLRTNMLFVKDVPSSLEEVRKMIKMVDVPVRQVLIEARFVEAGETFNQTLGGRLSYSGPTQAQGGGSLGGGLGRGSISGGSLNLPGAASGLGGLTMTLFNAAATRTLALELNASAIDGTTKNIASPRVVTSDKTAATIESGVEVPYQQASSSGATNVAFKKAVLGLTVTPQITPDDSVTMQISVSQDSVGNIFAGVPSINTKKVDTQVLVDNGGTVVIGGVYTQDESDSTSKVPGLGDIPILGWLFKNNTRTKSKKELLVFITPKILKDTLGSN
ncbi:type IV pilus secretin PilQ [Ferrigenium sp. UT5]|uniref:type IV pilus secretin PilQ n=1 Tax=Ferrigenium sp. UT5 TaxID=3242105 RepID=UPI0038B3065F